MRGTVSQNEDWRKALDRVRQSMEVVSGERGPTKAENLVQYAIEEVQDDIKRLKARIPGEG
jgi:hypothetical protein